MVKFDKPSSYYYFYVIKICNNKNLFIISMKKKKIIQREKERHDYALFENLVQKIELQISHI